ncbi:MAG: HAD family hydrolase [Asgard group archaeon]|nr:HAD family hydrolase [Asgard group archaeon]
MMIKMIEENQDKEETIIEEEIEEEKIEEVDFVKEITPKDDTPWIFFDYSGTLVDTVDALSRTYTKFLGRDFSPEQVKSLIKDFPKMGKIALFRKYKFNLFKFLFGGSNKFKEMRIEEFSSSVRAFPGIPEVLMRLQKIVAAKLAIVTHETELEQEENRQEILQKTGIPITFDICITDAKNKEIKFDEFITSQGISYGIFISDTQSDIEIGKKQNFKTIGVSWGMSSGDELNADFIINDPRELLQIIMNLMYQFEQKKLHGDPIIS